MTESNPYFPCDFLEHDGAFSVICSKFHYFDDHLDSDEIGGYSIERLAKQLLRELDIKKVKFDSEAGMFCAYSDDRESLKRLCIELCKFTDGEKEYLSNKQIFAPKLPLAEAEKYLVRGFVISLDLRAQDLFLENVPCPPTSNNQTENLRLLQYGTDTDKAKAARKITSEAASLVRKWDHYLSHPSTTKILLDFCASNRNSPVVFMELIRALSFISMRHLPDLRAEPFFRTALKDPKKDTRYCGLQGLYSLRVLTPEVVRPFLNDKASLVREAAERYLRWLEKPDRGYPSWMFDPQSIDS